MPEWRKTSEQIDWRAKQPSQVACFSEDLKCWEAWDSTYRHKAKDITPLVAWRREALKEEAPDDIPWKEERAPSSVRRTLKPFQRQRWGNFWERRGEAHMGFSKRIDTILNWIELNRTNGQLNFTASRSGLFSPVNSDCARQFSNRCEICEVSKVVHGNRSDHWPTNK